MKENRASLAVTTALICTVLLMLAPLAQAQSTLLGHEENIEVTISSEEHPIISLSADDYLFSIEYTALQYRSDEGISVISLDSDWEVDIESFSQHRYPHMNIAMETTLILEGHEIELYFDFNVISVKDTTELTFSFEIVGLDGDLLGDYYIHQNIDVNGTMITDAGQVHSGQYPINYFQFDLPDGLTGYYSWNSIAMVDVFNGGDTLYLGVSYTDPDTNKVSLSSIDIEKSMSSAIVPVPESYDRLPSFLVGMLVAGGFVIGMLFQERNRFYKKEDNTSIVRLEDSPYYKGKE